MLVAVAMHALFLTPPVEFVLFCQKRICLPTVELIDINKRVVAFIILYRFPIHAELVEFKGLRIWRAEKKILTVWRERGSIHGA